MMGHAATLVSTNKKSTNNKNSNWERLVIKS